MAYCINLTCRWLFYWKFKILDWHLDYSHTSYHGCHRCKRISLLYNTIHRRKLCHFDRFHLYLQGRIYKNSIFNDFQFKFQLLCWLHWLIKLFLVAGGWKCVIDWIKLPDRIFTWCVWLYVPITIRQRWLQLVEIHEG